MSTILKTIAHSTAQLGLGVFVGGVCNAVFPMAPNKKTELCLSELLWITGEVSLQLITNGLVVAAFLKALDKVDGGAFSDPTGALAYGWALQESQPQLMTKIRLLGSQLSATISRSEAALMNEFHLETEMSKRDKGMVQANMV